MREPAEVILHATCVVYSEKGILIRGQSGSGKSSLALELMALGATLVSDDRTIIQRRGERAFASAPHSIRGKIEARGIGILSAATQDEAHLDLIVDLDQTEPDRFPPQRSADILGIQVTVIQKTDTRHFPAAILQYVKGGRPLEG